MFWGDLIQGDQARWRIYKKIKVNVIMKWVTANNIEAKSRVFAKVEKPRHSSLVQS